MSDATRVPFVDTGLRYLAAPDEILPEGLRACAIVFARAIDELTNEPVSLPITVLAAGKAFNAPGTRSAVNPRAVDGAVIGLVGIPARVLPALGGTAYDVGIVARVPNYVPLGVTNAIGPFLNFPGTFTPLDLGDLALHREPVTFFGRTVKRVAGVIDKLDTATMTLSGIWRTLPTLTNSPPPDPANVVAISPTLYASRLVGTSVNIRTLTPDAAHEKKLTRAAVAGATEVYITDRQALAAGDLLGIDETDPSRSEWVRVNAVAGSTNPAEPAVVTLEYPLAHGHDVGALAHPTTVGAVSTTQSLSLDAIAGDTTLFVGGLGGLTNGAAEVDDGVAAPEYHDLALYSVDSDLDGQWRLPPLSRVAQVTITATHAGFTTPARTLTVEYPRREQRIDFVFT